MFEGNRECSICKSALAEKEKNFGVSLLGLTYVFCDKCIVAQKDEIKKILHDEHN
ncbi:Uncharacterised protein [Candidatus Bilamarchaeum dharawalense]|uniref:Uncharacterized protein n=1 Tax=Candidatus Bilamarchaeum dharawalense TaxID=2885759 RepID=A0A5E4LT71_9ARCH|nr:Uncharacterised protein [Candidatus Bilamarchaeum dharawalense]